MMKKYIQPAIVVSHIVQNPIMEGSLPKGGDDETIGGGNMWAPRFDGLDDEPEEKNSIWE